MKVLVQGWKNYPHSYSIVNVFQMLYLSRISGVTVYFEELPPYLSTWKRIDLEGILLTKEEVEELESTVIPFKRGMEVDMIYRISYPFDLSLPTMRGIPTCLFYTSEFQLLKDEFFAGGSDVSNFVEKCFNFSLSPVTPSQWSAVALLKHKFEPAIVSHGVDITKYYPTAENLRTQLNIPLEATVYLNMGAMTQNKGVIILIKAFYNTTFINENSYLVLKGLGDLYASKMYIDQAIAQLTRSNSVDLVRWKQVEKKIIFINETLGYKEMNLLYNTATAYVSPYLAEGFNLCVIEAMACGLPIICSDHGSTDDFTHPDFCLKPKTTICKPDFIDERFLVVDELSLEECMMRVSLDKEFRDTARVRAPEFVRANFTWECVADKLNDLFSLLVPKYDCREIIDIDKYTVLRP